MRNSTRCTCNLQLFTKSTSFTNLSMVDCGAEETSKKGGYKKVDQFEEIRDCFLLNWNLHRGKNTFYVTNPYDNGYVHCDGLSEWISDHNFPNHENSWFHKTYLWEIPKIGLSIRNNLTPVMKKVWCGDDMQRKFHWQLCRVLDNK